MDGTNGPAVDPQGSSKGRILKVQGEVTETEILPVLLKASIAATHGLHNVRLVTQNFLQWSSNLPLWSNSDHIISRIVCFRLFVSKNTFSRSFCLHPILSSLVPQWKQLAFTPLALLGPSRPAISFRRVRNLVPEREAVGSGLTYFPAVHSDRNDPFFVTLLSNVV